MIEKRLKEETSIADMIWIVVAGCVGVALVFLLIRSAMKDDEPETKPAATQTSAPLTPSASVTMH